jgi:fumarate hydratase class II
LNSSRLARNRKELWGSARATALGYDNASRIANYALDHELTLKQAALKLGFVVDAEFTKDLPPEMRRRA